MSDHLDFLFFYYKKFQLALYTYIFVHVCKYFCRRQISNLTAVLNVLHILYMGGYCHTAIWPSKKVEPVYPGSTFLEDYELRSFLPSTSPTFSVFTYLQDENGISLF